MCPIILTTIGSAMATIGGGAVATAATATATTAAGSVLGGAFAGMSSAALGFSTLTTAISGATAIMGQQSQAKAIEAQNKAQRQRYLQQTQVTNAALISKYDAMADRQMQENRLHSQKATERQRAYEEAMSQVTASAAESGTTGINLAAIRQSMDMEMGRGNVALGTNLSWRARQYQREQKGYRSTATGQILAATPSYEAPPSLVGPLLGTAGAGLGNLGKFGGEEWLSKISTKYAPKAPEIPKVTKP